jgi:hypothetical protein
VTLSVSMCFKTCVGLHVVAIKGFQFKHLVDLKDKFILLFIDWILNCTLQSEVRGYSFRHVLQYHEPETVSEISCLILTEHDFGPKHENLNVTKWVPHFDGTRLWSKTWESKRYEMAGMNTALKKWHQLRRKLCTFSREKNIAFLQWFPKCGSRTS